MLEQRDIAVRQATILDLDLLVPLFDAYRQFYRKPSDPDLARRFLLDRFQHNQSTIFLALRQDGSAARIFVFNALFVKPEARRMGVGYLLLSAAAHFGRASGAVRLTLSTEVTNDTAQALYEGEGWTRQTKFYAYDLTPRG